MDFQKAEDAEDVDMIDDMYSGEVPQWM